MSVDGILAIIFFTLLFVVVALLTWGLRLSEPPRDHLDGQNFGYRRSRYGRCPCCGKDDD
jgi:hypothetical protein